MSMKEGLVACQFSLTYTGHDAWSRVLECVGYVHPRE